MVMAKKGEEQEPTVTVVLEGRVDRLSAMRLNLPTKPPRAAQPTGEEGEAGAAEGEEGSPEPLSWTVAVASAANVSLAKDTALAESLAALSASWEKAQPGRAAKAKAIRDAYLAEMEKAAAEKADAEATDHAERIADERVFRDPCDPKVVEEEEEKRRAEIAAMRAFRDPLAGEEEEEDETSRPPMPSLTAAAGASCRRSSKKKQLPTSPTFPKLNLPADGKLHDVVRTWC